MQLSALFFIQGLLVTTNLKSMSINILQTIKGAGMTYVNHPVLLAFISILVHIRKYMHSNCQDDLKAYLVQIMITILPDQQKCVLLGKGVIKEWNKICDIYTKRCYFYKEMMAYLLIEHPQHFKFSTVFPLFDIKLILYMIEYLLHAI